MGDVWGYRVSTGVRVGMAHGATEKLMEKALNHMRTHREGPQPYDKRSERNPYGKRTRCGWGLRDRRRAGTPLYPCLFIEAFYQDQDITEWEV